jgi:hypothetical protein
MVAVLRSPLLHFVAVGASLFAATFVRPAGPPAPEPVVITAACVRQLRDDYIRATNLTATAADDRALVARAVDDELLYRDALARGLDRDDRTIRWQLAQKMRFLGDGDDEAGGDAAALARDAAALGLARDDPMIRRMLLEKVRLLVKDTVAREPVGDDELRAYLAHHADAYRAPSRVTFRHVFLSRARRGAGLESDARGLLARLRAGTAEPRGDGFPLGSTLRAQTPAGVAAVFGDDFAAAIATMPIGAWSGPLASPYGLHLVRVDAVERADVPPLDVVRDRVLAAIRRERTHARLAARLAELRRTHSVDVEWPADS